MQVFYVLLYEIHLFICYKKWPPTVGDVKGTTIGIKPNVKSAIILTCILNVTPMSRYVAHSYIVLLGLEVDNDIFSSVIQTS